MGLSNLPDGVTQGMIDRSFRGPCHECADGFHEGCEGEDCWCVRCEDAAAEDAAEARFEEERERRREARLFGDD